MNFGNESEIVEFKKSTSELKEEITSLIAMLNKHNEGTLYFGINNNGDVVGQKDITENTLRNISRAISAYVEPLVVLHISVEYINDKSIIKIYLCKRQRCSLFCIWNLLYQTG